MPLLERLQQVRPADRRTSGGGCRRPIRPRSASRRSPREGVDELVETIASRLALDVRRITLDASTPATPPTASGSRASTATPACSSTRRATAGCRSSPTCRGGPGSLGLRDRPEGRGRRTGRTVRIRRRACIAPAPHRRVGDRVRGCAPKVVQPPVVAVAAVPGFHRAGRAGRAGVDARGLAATTAAGGSCRPAIFATPSASSRLRCRRAGLLSGAGGPRLRRARAEGAARGAGALRPARSRSAPTTLSALVGRGEALLALKREADALAAFEARARRRSALTDVRAARRGAAGSSRPSSDLAAARQAAQAGRTRRGDQAYRAAIAARPTAPSCIASWRRSSARRGERRRGARALPHGRRARSDGCRLARRRSANPRGAAASCEALRPVRRGAGDRAERRSDATPGRAARTDRAGAAARRVPAIDRGAADHARRPGGAHRRPPRRLLLTPVARAAVVVTDVAQPLGRHVDHGGRARRRDGAVRQPHVSAARGRRARIDLAQAVSRVLARAALAPQERIRQWRAAAVQFRRSPAGHLAYPAASVAVASGVLDRPAPTTASSRRGASPARKRSRPIERLRAMAPLASGSSVRR